MFAKISKWFFLTDSKKDLHVDVARVKWSMKSNHVVVVQSLGQTDAGQMVVIDPFDTTSAIARELLPLKVLLINCQGGLLNDRNEVSCRNNNRRRCERASKFLRRLILFPFFESCQVKKNSSVHCKKAGSSLIITFFSHLFLFYFWKNLCVNCVVTCAITFGLQVGVENFRRPLDIIVWSKQFGRAYRLADFTIASQS